MTENNDEDVTKKKTIVNTSEIEHKSSQGRVLQSPDPCETPSEAEPIPIPYPNIAKSSDTNNGSKKVKVEGKEEVLTKKSDYVKSSGDEPGTDEETSWGVVESMKKTVTRTVKKHPLLTAIITLIVVLVVMVYFLNSSSTPIKYDEPVECIRALS